MTAEDATPAADPSQKDSKKKNRWALYLGLLLLIGTGFLVSRGNDGKLSAGHRIGDLDYLSEHRLLSTGETSIKLWDTENGNLVQTVDVPHKVRHAVLNTNGTLLAAVGNGVSVYDTETWERVLDVPDRRYGISTAVFHPNRPLLLVRFPGPPSEIRTWNTTSWEEVSFLEDWPLQARWGKMQFSPDGAFCAASIQQEAERNGETGQWKKRDDLVGVWDGGGNRIGLLSLKGQSGNPEEANSIEDLAFTPDGGHLIVARMRGFAIFETATWTQTRWVPFEVESQIIRSIAIDPGGRYLYTDAFQIYRYDLPDLTHRVPLPIRPGITYQIAASPGGKTLAVSKVFAWGSRPGLNPTISFYDPHLQQKPED